MASGLYKLTNSYCPTLARTVTTVAIAQPRVARGGDLDRAGAWRSCRG